MLKTADSRRDYFPCGYCILFTPGHKNSRRLSGRMSAISKCFEHLSGFYPISRYRKQKSLDEARLRCEVFVYENNQMAAIAKQTKVTTTPPNPPDSFLRPLEPPTFVLFDRPVPGIEVFTYVPLFPVDKLIPFPPTEAPMPDFDRLRFTPFAILIRFLKVHPMSDL